MEMGIFRGVVQLRACATLNCVSMSRSSVAGTVLKKVEMISKPKQCLGSESSSVAV